MGPEECDALGTICLGMKSILKLCTALLYTYLHELLFINTS